MGGCGWGDDRLATVDDQLLTALFEKYAERSFLGKEVIDTQWFYRRLRKSSEWPTRI